LIRYLFVSRELNIGPGLEERIRALQGYFPGAKAVIFFAIGDPPERDSTIIEFRSLGRWPRFLWHFAYPFYLWGWVREQVGLRAVILRRGVLPNPLLGLVFARRSFSFFTEHHTKRMDEFALLSRIPYWLVRPLFGCDRLSVDAVLDGKICLTGEIASSESFSGQTLILANPIIGDVYRDRVQPIFDGTELRVGMPVFEPYPWQGVDRLVRSAVDWSNSSPDLRVRVTLFGVDGPIESPHPRVTVERVGRVPGSELPERFSNQHLGISTLGLSRKGMEEACPLKSRLFVRARIPFIYGYTDPDLDSDSPVSLRVLNDESLIPWPLVYGFLLRVSYGATDLAWTSHQRQMSLGEKTRILARFLESNS